MKQIYKSRWFSRILPSLFLVTGAVQAQAYDFEESGIYYNILSAKEVAVTFATTSYNSYSGDVVIPESVIYNDVKYSVTSIGESAFDGCSGLTSVEISNSVTSIGEYAFDGCSGLTSFEIPNSVTSIGSEAFYGCSKLNKVIISDLEAWCRIDFVDLNSTPMHYANHLYLNDTEITELTIPEGIEEIKSYAFANWDDLTSVEIPNSVTSIGEFAFYVCRGLTSVSIGNSVTSIGRKAFNVCIELNKVIISDLEAWCKIDFEDSWSNPLYYEGGHLYLNDTEITELTIPEGIEEIKKYAFNGCGGLTSVSIGNSVTSIGAQAFRECNDLTSVSIGNSVTSIGGYAFNECSSLKSVSIGNSVTSIEDGAFYGCSRLKSIEIPNSVTSIGEDAFSSCSGLTSVSIGNSVTSIGESAFEGCSGLTSVSIGNSVTSIGESAFEGCRGLTSVTSLNVTPPSCGSSAFFLVPTFTCALYVPKQSVEAYKAAYQWKDFTNIQGVEYKVTDIEVAFEEGAGEDLYVGKSALYSATVNPSYAYDKTVTWSIEDESVASLSYNENGTVTVTALKVGSTTLKATANDGSEVYGEATVTVVAKEIPAESISIAGAPESLNIGETAELKAVISPEDATYTEVQWESSDESVATVSEEGVVTALADGDVTIKVTVVGNENVTASCEITVLPVEAQSVVIINVPEEAITLDNPVTLIAIVSPDNTTYPEVEWSSSDTSVATVSDEGVVTGISDGTVTITVTVKATPSVTDSCEITVDNSTALSQLKVDEKGLYNVYDAKGQKVMATKDATDLAKLPRDLYIINGKKVMITK